MFNDCIYNDNYRIVSDWEFFIKKIIFANCSYNYIPIIISVFDDNGISSTNCKLNNCERITVLKSILPQRILADYEKFKDKESPVLYLIPEFNHTYRLEKLIYWMIKIILKIYKLVK